MKQFRKVVNHEQFGCGCKSAVGIGFGPDDDDPDNRFFLFEPCEADCPSVKHMMDMAAEFEKPILPQHGRIDQL